MASFLFVVTLPTANYEKILKTKGDQNEKLNSPSYDDDLFDEEVSESLSSESSVTDHEQNDEKKKVSDYDGKPVNDNLDSKQTPEDIKKEETETLLSTTEDEIPLEDLVSRVLSRLRVFDSCWNIGRPNDNQIRVSFTVRGGVRCERMLRALRSTGIGTKEKSSLAVIPCALHYTPPKKSPPHHRKSRLKQRSQRIQNSTWSTFVQSVRSRLVVAQVTEQIRAGGILTFDFCCLTILAALLSAIGLAENSTVFVVASMLISPLMGPIMAGTFGTAIRDRDLQIMGVKNELIGLFLTTVVGFVVGLIICGIDEHYGVGDWPTFEITTRSELRSLWVGALTAIPSGAAVAIAVLSDNTASLVGVAISASLLPPAVNAGLLWAMSATHFIFIYEGSNFTSVVKTNDYSDNPAAELAVDGFISLCLTLVNILCIYLAGVLVYKIKEVAPLHTKDEHFWKHDIKLARNFNKNNHDETKSRDELANIESATNDDNFEDAVNRVKAWDTFCPGDKDLLDRFKRGRENHLTWSPNSDLNYRTVAYELRGKYKKNNNDLLNKPRLSIPTVRLSSSHNHHYKGKMRHLPTIPQAENISPAHSSELIRKDSKFTVIPVTNEKK